MSVKIKDISDKTGFAISTVSKALSNSTDISESSRTAILKCAVEMGYILGRKKKKTKGTIAAVVEGIVHTDMNRFEYQMLFGFQRAAAMSDYDVEIIAKPRNDYMWSYHDNVFNKDFSGAFLLRLGYGTQNIKDIEETTMPILLFDHVIDKKNSAYIGCDNSVGIREIVKHLVELGHTKIAFYGGTPMAQVSQERKESFILTLRSLGVKVYPEMIFESDFSQNYSDKIVPKIVDFGATAIVCASDWLAKFVIDELKNLHLKVPQDISVTGFDNVSIAEELTPMLTTVSQNCVDMGKSGFYVLQELIQGNCISKLLFRPSIVIRDSTSSVKIK